MHVTADLDAAEQAVTLPIGADVVPGDRAAGRVPDPAAVLGPASDVGAGRTGGAAKRSRMERHAGSRRRGGGV